MDGMISIQNIVYAPSVQIGPCNLYKQYDSVVTFFVQDLRESSRPKKEIRRFLQNQFGPENTVWQLQYNQKLGMAKVYFADKTDAAECYFYLS
jgi:hypothetical protein